MTQLHRTKDLSGATAMDDRITDEQSVIERDDISVAHISPPLNSSAATDTANQSRASETLLLELMRIGLSHRVMIATWTAGGLLLGWLAALAMGPSYTAVAILQPNLMLEAPATGVQAAILDASFLLENEIELISSQPLTPALTAKLNQDFPPPSGDALSAQVSGLIKVRIEFVLNHFGLSELQRVRDIRKDRVDPVASDDITLEVSRRKRTYLLEVSVKTSTPARAAAFANAIAGQYARNNQLRRMKVRELAAQQALSDLLLNYGDRHPLVQRARRDLQRLQYDSEIFRQTPATFSENELPGTDTVVPAHASLLLANSHYRTIATWGLLGLFCALGLAFFKERRRLLH